MAANFYDQSLRVWWPESDSAKAKARQWRNGLGARWVNFDADYWEIQEQILKEVCFELFPYLKFKICSIFML